ncbi:MAG: FGGY family carbohydrate kinase [Opitutaceae bacterium]
MATYQVAAVDLGATSGRVILGTYNRNGLKLEEVHRFPNRFDELGGHHYWNLPGLMTEVVTGLKEAKRRAPKLASIGVDVWGCDTVLVDGKGRLVFPPHAYRDTRTETLYKQLARKGLTEVYGWTGIPNLSYNTSLQLQELIQRFPDLADMADRCLWLPDYFNFLLSGKMENEISVASTSQLLDVRSREMSRSALNFFRIPPTWFSEPKLSPARLGRVKGIPELKDVEVIMVPGHDTACAYDAMPAAEEGTDFFISSGTWSLMGFESDKPVLGLQAQKDIVCNERLGDGRYRPLKTIPGLWLLEQILPAFTVRPKSNAEWNRLIKAAAASPAPEHLIDLRDRALFNPSSMKDAIDRQLKRRKVSPPTDLAGYTRLICESLGKGHANAVRSFELMTGKEFERILIVGGGSKNRLLCQTTANHSGLPVVSFALEGTATGNIANQLIGLGAVRDLKQFRAGLNRQLKKKVFRPE